jgi:hypothetical protein
LEELIPYSPPPRHPKKFISRSPAIIRLRHERTGDISQYEGFVYRLDENDSSAITLYGGHQVVVLNKEIPEFENYTIVSMIEPWS